MDTILIVDYGSQYNQLISRRIREMNVFAKIVSYHEKIDYNDKTIKGVILSGGPNSVYDNNAPTLNLSILALNVPILGICYGMQLVMQDFGGKVQSSQKREYGHRDIQLIKPSKLTKGLKDTSTVWMSHADHVTEVPNNFEVIAKSDTSIAAAQNLHQQIYTVQFHPEVTHTEEGMKLLSNFVFDICETKASWDLEDFTKKTVKAIRDEVKDDQVILGLSGGVDSTVAAALLYQAIQDQLICIFVDTGLLRKDEAKEVLSGYESMPNLNIVKIDAKERFFKALKGVTDPEQKRKIIGKEFFEVFETAKASYSNVKYLAQGTIYPDIIESKSVLGPSQTIKSHHNVGGVPKNHAFQIIEPLKTLFKDEVRAVGMKLGLAKTLVYRHPFPGPGLGIRVIGLSLIHI